jgi:hypothetical protein
MRFRTRVGGGERRDAVKLYSRNIMIENRNRGLSVETPTVRRSGVMASCSNSLILIMPRSADHNDSSAIVYGMRNDLVS